MLVSIITNDDLCELELVHKRKFVNMRSRRTSRRNSFSDLFIFTFIVKGLLILLGMLLHVKK